jgi:hypothetical protein
VQHGQYNPPASRNPTCLDPVTSGGLHVCLHQPKPGGDILYDIDKPYRHTFTCPHSIANSDNTGYSHAYAFASPHAIAYAD